SARASFYVAARSRVRGGRVLPLVVRPVPVGDGSSWRSWRACRRAGCAGCRRRPNSARRRAVPIGHLLERCWLAGRPRVLTSLWCLLLRLLAAQRCSDFVGVEFVDGALGPVLGFVGPLPQVACHAHLLAFGQVLCGGLCGVAPGGDGQERG